MASEINNYIKDDWDDNALSGRTNAQKGYYKNYYDDGTGDLLKGVYRPVWNNQRNNGNLSVGSGTVTYNNDTDSNDAGENLVVPSALTSGEWSFDVTVTTSSSDGDGVALMMMQQQLTASSDFYGTGYWMFLADSDASYKFRISRLDNGSVTELNTSSWSGDNNTHTFTATRDSFGNMEYFEDGGSKGTATDSTYLETKVTGISFRDSQGGITVDVDNFVAK